MSFAATPQPPKEPVQVGQHFYIVSKMELFAQLNVMRKLGPIIARTGAGFITDPPKTLEDTMTRLEPAVDQLSAMSEEDFNYVLHHCLSVVRRVQGQMLQPVFNAHAKQMQFNDVNAAEALQLVALVIGDNLGSFFDTSEQSTGDPASPQSGPSNGSTWPTIRSS